jgi:glycosyltransferase involved in cell wall biosynthesis
VIRIFAVIASSEVGGAERSFVTTLAGLDRSRFEVSVACHGHGPMVREYRKHAARLWSFDLVNVFDPRTVRRLRTLMDEVKPAIVHTHLWSADLLAGLAARLAGVPVIVSTVHGAYHVPIGVRGVRQVRRASLSLGYRTVYRWFDRIIAVSSHVRDDLVNRQGVRVEPRSIEVIPNGLDLRRIEPILDRAVLSDTRLESSAATRIVSVANFFPLKGHEYLLRAMPHVLRELPDVRCVLVGDGPERPGMERLAASLRIATHVDFCGTVSDPLGLVADSAVFVLPGLESEGFPIALLEALALGRPVVAIRAGGVPEIIEQGRTGLLVPPRDPVALAESIVRLLRDRVLARCLGESGREEVRARFSAEVMVERTEALYQELARAKGILRYDDSQIRS